MHIALVDIIIESSFIYFANAHSAILYIVPAINSHLTVVFYRLSFENRYLGPGATYSGPSLIRIAPGFVTWIGGDC